MQRPDFCSLCFPQITPQLFCSSRTVMPIRVLYSSIFLPFSICAPFFCQSIISYSVFLLFLLCAFHVLLFCLRLYFFDFSNYYRSLSIFHIFLIFLFSIFSNPFFSILLFLLIFPFCSFLSTSESFFSFLFLSLLSFFIGEPFSSFSSFPSDF